MRCAQGNIKEKIKNIFKKADLSKDYQCNEIKDV